MDTSMEISLTSGRQVKLKQMSLLEMAMNGELKPELMKVTLAAKQGEELTVIELMAKYGPLVNRFCELALVEPKMDVRDLGVTERMEIFNRLNRGVLELQAGKKASKTNRAFKAGAGLAERKVKINDKGIWKD